MKYHVYLETTNWTVDIPNHVYIFKEKPSGRTAKAVGYVKAGTNKVQKFKSPMTLDLKDRSFVMLDK